ncbi:MAG TPA: AbrB/MazE/SpoVT family DNA-binding domain-containing protein [Pyrodictium sp.]|nr:AbrB/MazE/SpoVT family DNA-binding domain-containing protein [Pyrodictium sp.]
MKLAEIVRVDSKGRITIPMIVREALNIVEGMNLILIADSDKKQIILSPLPSTTEKLYEVYMEFRDVPGAFARISEKLVDLDIEQISTQCTVVKRGELAECMLVIDMSKAKIQSMDELKKKLMEVPDVRMVSIRPLRR